MAEHQIISEEEERRLIVDKYQKGRDKIKEQIDDWEDPSNEIYHVTDRYGFIHDHRLPSKLTEYESKIRNTEASRSDKWVKMLKQWDKYFPGGNFEKLRKRVYKGIPNLIRGDAWCRLLGVPTVMAEQEGRYDEMLKFGLLYSKDIRQIDLDVNRTFRNNVTFRERYNTKQQELFRVLVAYSVYNAEIGYCQGMSQIAALLLMYTSEEYAFWAMDRLMSHDKYAMHGFFIPGFPKLVRFARHHDLVLKRYLPKVYKHFKKYDIDSTLYTLKWFFQCFLDRVPFSLTLRLWDVFMLEGEVILTCMSYTLLKLHKKTILKKGMEELIEFLQVELEKDFGYHDDQAITALQQSITELKRHKMDLPKEAPSESEKPTRPFGFLLEADNLSIMTGDDRSLAGSIILRPSDIVSLAQTSRTGSEADERDFDDNEHLDNVEVNDFCKLQRSLSLYDNVDVNESIEAAKRLSGVSDAKGKTGSIHSQNEHMKCSSNSSSPARKCQRSPVISVDGDVPSRSSQQSYVAPAVKELPDTKPLTNASVDDVPLQEEKIGNTVVDQVKNIAFIDAVDDSQLTASTSDPSPLGVNGVENGVPLVDEQYGVDREQIFTQVSSCEESSIATHSKVNSAIEERPLAVRPTQIISESYSTSEKVEVIESKTTSQVNQSNRSSSTRKTFIPKLARRSSESKNGTAEETSNPVSPTSSLSPTSPTGKISLIPRYVSRSPSTASTLSSISTSTVLNQEMSEKLGKSNDRALSPNDESSISYSEDSSKLRIYVPFGKQSPSDSNKIRLTVASPTQNDLTNQSPPCLPAIDT